VKEEPALDTSILIPVSGTDVARRGADVALVLASAAHAQVRALYVSPTTARRLGGLRRRRAEAAVLKDISELGARYDIAIHTQVETHDLAEAPIVKEAMKRHDLIVMGVSRRPGDALFFGNTAASLMRMWKGAILFVAS
jgi:nucleotide-binding universal stress UspA family protein